MGGITWWGSLVRETLSGHPSIVISCLVSLHVKIIEIDSGVPDQLHAARNHMENIRAALSKTWVGSCARVLKGLARWLNVTRKVVLIKLRCRLIGVTPPEQANGRIYLHLGCGAINHEQFINIDGYPHPHVHYVQSIDKLPQFLNGTVDLIYASHCLEHFSYTQTKFVLEEWYRVLKEGAILRLSVPDFDKLVEIYNAHDRNPNVILPQLMGGHNNKYNFHLTALNMHNLSKLLTAAGFSKIQEWRPGTEVLTTFNDFSAYKKEIAGKLYEVSLNIEAIK